jgi:hypothetical protein
VILGAISPTPCPFWDKIAFLIFTYEVRIKVTG